MRRQYEGVIFHDDDYSLLTLNAEATSQRQQGEPPQVMGSTRRRAGRSLLGDSRRRRHHQARERSVCRGRSSPRCFVYLCYGYTYTIQLRFDGRSTRVCNIKTEGDPSQLIGDRLSKLTKVAVT